jgi:hypothetical protein
MQHSDSQSKTASAISSAEELEKQRRKQRREKFLDKIRDSLGSVVHQMALSPTEVALLFGKSATWGYRRIYDGTFRVISSGNRLMIPRAEIERFIARADKYDPQPRNGGEDRGQS